MLAQPFCRYGLWTSTVIRGGCGLALGCLGRIRSVLHDNVVFGLVSFSVHHDEIPADSERG